MLDLAKVGPRDVVVDLGCGDGRLLIAAAKTRGASGYGVDLDGDLVRAARLEAVRQGVQDKVRFETQNLYVTDISRASVVTLYLFPRVNMELRPRLLAELKPGTRVVSHEFDFGDWKPDAQVTVPVPDKPYGPPRSVVFLWIVPADVSGRWSWNEAGDAMEVDLQQQFQAVTATSRAGAAEAKLSGDALTLVVVAGGERRVYSGRVEKDRISGTVTAGGASAPWTAMRVARGKS
jgi:SAM-dependent methyltransferase